MNSSRVRYSLVLAVLLLLPSCITTRVVETWKDPAWRQAPATNLFVIAVIKNRGPRSVVEAALVDKLKSRGISATASTGMFPEEALPNREIAIAKAKELGADGALVVRFLNKEIGETHTPGRIYGEQPDFDETWQDTATAAPDAATPEVAYDFTVVRMKTLLYRTGSDKPVWSVTTETTYQEKPLKQTAPFAAAIVRRLERDKMIK